MKIKITPFILGLYYSFLIIILTVSSIQSSELLVHSDEIINLLPEMIFNRSISKIEEEDHPCEQITGKMIKYMLNQAEMSPDIQDFFKFAFYSGTGLNDWGDYFNCKKMNISNYHTIKYTVKNDALPQSISITLGICYFKECDADYFNKVKQDIANLINRTKGIDIHPDNLSIYDPEQKVAQLRNDSVVGLSISVSVLGLLIMLNFVQCFLKTRPVRKTSVIYDADEEKKSQKSLIEKDAKNNQLSQNSQNNGLSKVMQFFDFSTNIVKIVSHRSINDTHEALKVFDGIRFLSTCWVVFGHTHLLPLNMGLKNILDLPPLSKTVKGCFLLAAPYSVDVFFYMSGFLLAFSMQRILNKKIGKIKMFLMAIFNRYIRLLPFYLFCLVGITYIVPFLGSGPTYQEINTINGACPTSFWHHLLYFNNLAKSSLPGRPEDCAGHTWYLANDMQFFILAILLFIFLNNLKWVRNLIFSLLFIGSNAISIWEVYKYQFRFNDANHTAAKSAGDFFNDFYIKPWIRIGPYLLGVFFCELFIETPVYRKDYVKEQVNLAPDSEKNTGDDFFKLSTVESIPIARRLNNFLISSNITCYVILFFSLILINATFLSPILTNVYDLEIFWHAMFNTFNKLLFVGGLACIVHLTFLGKLTFIRNFLSHMFFKSMSKITFGIYIIHFYVIGVYVYSYNVQFYLNMSDFAFFATGLTIVTTLLSLLLTTIIDSPIVHLLKSLFGQGKKGSDD